LNPRRQKPVNVDRLPPHDLEAERGVLGCLMVSPNEALAESIEVLKDNGQEFYDLRHMTIWDVLVEMYDKREGIDVITVQNRLKEKDMLEQVGGLQYLAALPDAVPSAANLSYYLEIIREKFILRRAVQICTEVVARIYDYTGEVDSLMDGIEMDLIKLRESRIIQENLNMRELVIQCYQQIQDFNERRGMLTGIGTGFVDFDKMTSGLQPAEMIVIAARPSMGKTSLAMNIAETVAIEQKLPVGIFSLEMSASSLVMRMLCSLARVNLRDVREGFLADRDIPKLTNAANWLMRAPIYIDDSSTLTVLQMRAKARRMRMRYGIKLLLVDYMQLLAGGRRGESRQQEISDISRGIKALAKELNVPIIVLSQLNRELEREKNRKPRLSDLRESGAIEQDADLVGLLYRPSYGDEEDRYDEVSYNAVPINLLIAKQRNGPTGDVNLTFLKSYTRFESASRVREDAVPTQGTLV